MEKQLWQQNDADHQVWQITPTRAGILADGIYSIAASANGGLLLDASNNISGSNVRIYNQANSNMQKWKLTTNNDGTYYITNVASGLSLDVYGGYTNNEANVQVFTAHYGQNQKWKIEQNADGTYSIRSANSNKSLDIYGGTANGNNVQQYSWHGGDNQRWRIVKD